MKVIFFEPCFIFRSLHSNRGTLRVCVLTSRGDRWRDGGRSTLGAAGSGPGLGAVVIVTASQLSNGG